MPAIPVSGVYGDNSSYAGAGHLLETREWRHTVGQSGMTPTAFAFLIPVFVMAVATPALCVFFVRKRRQTQVTPLPGAKPLKKPPLARDVAREKLKDVTEVSSLPGESEKEKNSAQVTTTEEKDVTKVESRSIYEKECAICLSTLYAPSPPEPAKLIAESTTKEIDLEAASTITPTPSTTEIPSTDASSTTLTPDTPALETILKLQTCDHAFHSECLVSWFVLRKTSCPICRAAYFSKEDLQKLDDEAAAANPPPPPPPPPVSNWRYFLHGHRAMRGQPEPAVHPSHNSRIEIRPSRVG